MRKIGIFYAYWTKDWDADFLPYVGKVKALGFDQLEVHGNGIVNMTPFARRDLGAAASDAGITLSYGIGLSPNQDVSSPDDHVREAGIAHMRKVMRAIGEMAAAPWAARYTAAGHRRCRRGTPTSARSATRA